jgi:hypothetical protein
MGPLLATLLYTNAAPHAQTLEITPTPANFQLTRPEYFGEALAWMKQNPDIAESSLDAIPKVLDFLQQSLAPSK